MTIRLQCLCGAWIEADEAAREPAVCGGCGASFELGGAVETVGAPDADSVPKLDCPACGGQAEVVWRGAQGRDRFLSCLHCGTEVDLPESRGTTRERITERPGERVVERVTSWESVAPGPDGSPLPAQGFDHVEVHERGFGSLEEMERHLRSQLPEDLARQTLDAMRRAIRDGGDGTTVIEHSHTSSETKVVPVGPSHRRR